MTVRGFEELFCSILTQTARVCIGVSCTPVASRPLPAPRLGPHACRGLAELLKCTNGMLLMSFSLTGQGDTKHRFTCNNSETAAQHMTLTCGMHCAYVPMLCASMPLPDACVRFIQDKAHAIQPIFAALRTLDSCQSETGLKGANTMCSPLLTDVKES